MNADANVEYPRFRWLVTDKIAGAPHPDLSGAQLEAVLQGREAAQPADIAS